MNTRLQKPIKPQTNGYLHINVYVRHTVEDIKLLLGYDLSHIDKENRLG